VACAFDLGLLNTWCNATSTVAWGGNGWCGAANVSSCPQANITVAPAGTSVPATVAYALWASGASSQPWGGNAIGFNGTAQTLPFNLAPCASAVPSWAPSSAMFTARTVTGAFTVSGISAADWIVADASGAVEASLATSLNLSPSAVTLTVSPLPAAGPGGRRLHAGSGVTVAWSAVVVSGSASPSLTLSPAVVFAALGAVSWAAAGLSTPIPAASAPGWPAGTGRWAWPAGAWAPARRGSPTAPGT
jgi:hypothetical protein